MNRILMGLAIAASGLVFTVGCTSTTTGNLGNLDFSYTADDQVNNFNKPVAVGAKLELRVLETGTRRPVEVQDASSDTPDVLDVDTFSSNRVIIVGKGDGSAQISVTAKKPNGSVVDDMVNMLAATPEVLKLSNTCGGDNAKYFAGTKNLLIPFDMSKKNGQPVIGYGYFPIDVSGDADLTLDQTSTDQANFHFDVGDTTGTATIASTIDDTKLDVDVVTIADVDGVAANAKDPKKLTVDHTAFFHVWPTVGGVEVCQSDEKMTAATSTTDICTVKAVGTPDSTNSFDKTGWVQIDGKAFGSCKFTVTYPDANGGSGASQDFTWEIGSFPSDTGTNM